GTAGAAHPHRRRNPLAARPAARVPVRDALPARRAALPGRTATALCRRPGSRRRLRARAGGDEPDREDCMTAPHPRYPTLFSPLRLGPRVARNRTWMSAHATLLVKDHLFTEAHLAYYAERARHGVAVITMEAMAVHETSLPYRGKALAYDDRMVPQYRRIADAVHEHGALILAQPWHRGRETNSVASGQPVWAPSAIPCSVYREMPHAMTVEDIDAIIRGYRLS